MRSNHRKALFWYRLRKTTGFLVSIAAATTTGLHAENGPGWTGPRDIKPFVPLKPHERKVQATSSDVDPQKPKTASVVSQASNEGATTITPELQALANGLRNDPLAIFNYVRNKVRYQPYFGSFKGAHTTYLDGAGNDMDQASLLITLLNAAGYANTSYVYGKISMKNTAADGNDLAHWMAVDPASFNYMFGAAGIPLEGGINYGTYLLLTFDHVWVRLTVDGNTYDLDPSYKKSIVPGGIDLRAASGYSRSQLLGDAGGTTGADYVQNINRAALESRLGQYASNLRANLAANHPHASTEEILGGPSILESISGSLSEATSSLADFSPVVKTTFTTPPLEYKARLRVQIGGQIDKTFDADSLQSRPLCLVFSGANAQLWLGNTMVAQEVGGSGTTADVTLSVSHPDPDRSQNLGVAKYKRTGSYALTYAFYPNPLSSGQIDASSTRLQNYIAAGLSDSTREVLTEALHQIGIKWVKSVALTSHIVGETRGTISWVDHVIGRTGQESGYYVDMPGVFSTEFTREGGDPQASSAIAFIMSAMEHGVIEQNGGSAALSTVKCLQLANDGGQKLFRANQANWPAVSAQLTNYRDTSSLSSRIASGGTLLLHQDGQTGLNQWKGYGFASITSTLIGMQIAGGYAGGYNSTTEPLSGGTLNSLTGIATPPAAQPTQNSSAASSGNQLATSPTTAQRAASDDPVDLATGAFFLESDDLSLGSSDSPRGLVLRRFYDSGRKFQASALGNGWRHSFEGKVSVFSDLDAAFGARQPADAVQTVVAALAVPDFTDTSYTAKEMMVGALAANWLVNSINSNSAVVQIGAEQLAYTRLPDGTWNRPPGSTTDLTGTNGAFVVRPRFGGTTSFGTNNRITAWTDVDNNTQSYAYDTFGRLATVTDSTGRVLTFSYLFSTNASTNDLIRSVSDGTGRSVTYSYTSNNLTGIQDPEGFTKTIGYDTRNRIIDMRDPSGAYLVRNEYDAQDRVIRQFNQGVTNREWQFLYAPGTTTEIDPLGNATTHRFDSKNRRVAIVDPLGNASAMEYNGQNHVARTVDPAGRYTWLSYDANQNLIQKMNNAGEATTYTYDGAMRLWKVADPTGRVTEYGYDNRNRLTSFKDPGGRITTTTYRSDGRPAQITDPAGKSTTFTAYDQWGNATGVTRTDGTTTSAVFNVRGDMTSSTDGRGYTTTFTYDKRRLLTTRTDPLGKVTRWSYDGNGLLASTTDRNSNTTTSVYDNLGNLKSISTSDGATTTMGYDERLLQTSVTDALGRTTTRSYDAARRPVAVTDPLSIVSQTVYNAAGQMIQAINGLNQATRLHYDAVGRLSYTLDPMNRRAVLTYDAAGRQLTLQNRLNKNFAFGYSSDGLATTLRHPSGRESGIAERDAAGRPSVIKDTADQRTSLTYDGAGRIKSQSDPVGTITYTYDGEGNPTAVAEGAKTITRTFDALDRLASCTDVSGNTVSYAYDTEGNLSVLTYPDGKAVSYTYDSMNRLKTVTDWASRVTIYTYDVIGRLIQVDRPNGTRQRLQYDDGSRLTASFEEKGAMKIWQATYSYDAAHRMTAYTPTPATRTYVPTSATMNYNADNQLVSYNGQAVASDNNGNLLDYPAADGTMMPLTWDARNRLIETDGTSYVYDAENRRVRSAKLGQSTMYTWNRGQIDQLLVKQNPDGSINRYVYGIGLIYEETTPHETGTPAASYYHFNWQGSTVALSDASGNVTARISYSPYGERTIESGTVFTPFCFVGRFGVLTESNGKLAMMARFYSPVYRRFLCEDPSGFDGGLNAFTYCLGDPLNLIDPDGEAAMLAAILVLKAAAWGAGSGAATDILLQGASNLAAGNDAFSNIDWASVGTSSAIGGAAGATGIGLLAQAEKLGKAFKVYQQMKKNVRAREIAMAKGKYRNPKTTAKQIALRDQAAGESVKAVALGSTGPAGNQAAKNIRQLSATPEASDGSGIESSVIGSGSVGKQFWRK